MNHKSEQHEQLETPLLVALIGCLKNHADRLPHPTLAGMLDELLESPDQQQRGLAIDLMGEVGELDAIERVCIVPATAQEIPRIQAMVARILQRPRNILSLSPHHFERFTAHLLRKLNYRHVEVTRKSHDGGIDVVAYLKVVGFGEEIDEKWIVQCKRYKRGSRVRREDVDALLRVREACGAGKALLITTSSFSSGALERVDGRTDIHLTDGEKLLQLLRAHYGPNRYVIRPEDGLHASYA